MAEAVIVEAVRSAVGKRNGGLSGVHPAELSAQVLNGLVERAGVDPAVIDDVIWGCVMQAGEQALDIARTAVLTAGWPETIPGVTVDRQCGSSQQSVHFAAAGVVAGHYDAVVAELQELPTFLLETKRGFEARAPEVAAAIAAADYHLIIGAGSTWAEAFYYGMCILEEMQWIRTRPVHADYFFHGPLELVEEGVSCLVFKGEDGSAPLLERVENFVTEYGGRLTVLDTAELAVGLSARTRSLISPIILATVLERVSAHLEVMRDHPLTTRRYYRRVSY